MEKEPIKPFGLSVRILLKDTQHRVLLVKRAQQTRTNPGRWELPGGKLDPRESFTDGLQREVREETGLDISLHHALGVAEQELPDFRVIHLILTATTENPFIHLSEEHEEYRWVSFDEMKSLDLADWLKSFFSNSPFYDRGPIMSNSSQRKNFTASNRGDLDGQGQ